jgi:hypothetical protein
MYTKTQITSAYEYNIKKAIPSRKEPSYILTRNAELSLFFSISPILFV